MSQQDTSIVPMIPAGMPEAVPSPAVEVKEFQVPAGWRESRRHQERVVVAGRGPQDTGVMFVTSSVMDEETNEEELGSRGVVHKRKPAYLKGPHGMALKDLCTSVGILVDQDVYFTALCKWLLPRETRLNPKLGEGAPGFACLERELSEVKPKIVVTFGKAAFEFMTGLKIKFNDAIGIWFWSEKYSCRVMPMSHVWYVAGKPEWTERYRIDFAQVKQAMEEMRGVVVSKWPTEYRVVKCAGELQDLVREVGHTRLISADCEWHGKNHVDGLLRSLQVAWAPGQAAYIRFMDDKLQRVFDVDYRQAGKILAPWWNEPETFICGHQLSADLSWTSSWLGLDWYRKARLDTLFAYQCCNEHADKGLERMSTRFTDLGRYEAELDEWKRQHKVDVTDGYGLIPDEILIPYGLKDADVPIRSLVYIERDLDQQGMLDYYRNIMNPFVTDVFTHFSLTGLPMNKPLLDVMREMYTFAYQEMDVKFKQDMHQEAWKLLAQVVAEELPGTQAMRQALPKEQSDSVVQALVPRLQAGFEGIRRAESKDLMTEVTKAVQAYIGDNQRGVSALSHLRNAPEFNIRSGVQLKQWLFDVKQYTPVKSTANKGKGMPSMSWEKIMNWSPKKREGIEPAVDKQTIQILAAQHDDKMLDSLLNLNAVGNTRKAFLKEPERDENGQVVEEAGFHAWICSDERLHGLNAMTETGRPRAFNPNTLNLPSFVQDRIADSIGRVLKAAAAGGRLPAQFQLYADGEKVPSLRSAIQAPPGWCITESDYRTAEIRGLAFISGDPNLIRIVTEPDPQFAVSIKGDPIRIMYASDCGIPEAEQHKCFLMSCWSDGKKLYDVTEKDLRRHPNGCLVHPDHDLHWSLIELVRKKSRESMYKKVDRGAGKVANFSCISRVSKVLTDAGVLPILSVDPKKHKLWDGVEWVSFDGIIEKPPQHLITYHGLTATVDHGVWTDDGREIFFGEAALLGLRLAKTQTPSGTPCRVEFRSAGSGPVTAHAGCDTSLLPLSHKLHEEPECHVPHGAYHMLGLRGGSGAEKPAHALPRHASALQHGHACVVSQLQGAGHPMSVQEPEGVRPVGAEHVSGGRLQGQGLRPHRQQRTLLPGEPQAGEQAGEPEEHQVEPELPFHTDRVFHGCTPGDNAEEEHHSQPAAAGDVGRAGGAALPRGGGTAGRCSVVGEVRAGHSCSSVPGVASRGRPDSADSGTVAADGLQGDGGAGELAALGEQHQHAERAEGDGGVSTAAPGGDAGFRHLEQIVLRGSGCDGGAEVLGRLYQEEWEHVATRQGVHGGKPSGCHERVRHPQGVHTRCHGGRAGSSVLGLNGYRGRPKEVLLRLLQEAGFAVKVEPVYDLLNAGPRHRFTADGVLVSNSAYGATPATLERKIEADTGVKPEPGTGQALLDALKARQPVAEEFLRNLELTPENPGFLRAASGKVRHFVLPPEVAGFSGRLRNSIVSAQGREARNFFMQESVACTAQRAANWLLDFKMQHGLQGGAITVLYDSVVTLCPLEERFIWSKAHEVCMHLGNGWQYHGRVLRYPIDTEFNAGWSLRPKDYAPTRALAAQYDSPDYCGTPESLKPMETWLDSWIEYLRSNENASLTFSGLR